MNVYVCGLFLLSDQMQSLCVNSMFWQTFLIFLQKITELWKNWVFLNFRKYVRLVFFGIIVFPTGILNFLNRSIFSYISSDLCFKKVKIHLHKDQFNLWNCQWRLLSTYFWRFSFYTMMFTITVCMRFCVRVRLLSNATGFSIPFIFSSIFSVFFSSIFSVASFIFEFSNVLCLYLTLKCYEMVFE